MIDVLSDPQHRVANFLFIAFNVLAVITVLAGMIGAASVFQAPELRSPAAGAWQLIMLGSISCSTLFLTSIYLTLAQLLRYAANIASAVSFHPRPTP